MLNQKVSPLRRKSAQEIIMDDTRKLLMALIDYMGLEAEVIKSEPVKGDFPGYWPPGKDRPKLWFTDTSYRLAPKAGKDPMPDCQPLPCGAVAPAAMPWNMTATYQPSDTCKVDDIVFMAVTPPDAKYPHAREENIDKFPPDNLDYWHPCGVTTESYHAKTD